MLRRQARDVLPVRAALAVVQLAAAEQRRQHGVVPGPDRLAKAARRGELLRVALPLRGLARQRVLVGARGQRQRGLGRLGASAAGRADREHHQRDDRQRDDGDRRPCDTGGVAAPAGPGRQQLLEPVPDGPHPRADAVPRGEDGLADTLRQGQRPQLRPRHGPSTCRVGRRRELVEQGGRGRRGDRRAALGSAQLAGEALEAERGAPQRSVVLRRRDVREQRRVRHENVLAPADLGAYQLARRHAGFFHAARLQLGADPVEGDGVLGDREPPGRERSPAQKPPHPRTAARPSRPVLMPPPGAGARTTAADPRPSSGRAACGRGRRAPRSTTAR